MDAPPAELEEIVPTLRGNPLVGLTVNKDMDYVNGMEAVVEAYYDSGLRVKTKTGYIVMVYPWTDDMRNTFNLGLGMVLAVPVAEADALCARLGQAWVVGEVVGGQGVAFS